VVKDIRVDFWPKSKKMKFLCTFLVPRCALQIGYCVLRKGPTFCIYAANTEPFWGTCSHLVLPKQACCYLGIILAPNFAGNLPLFFNWVKPFATGSEVIHVLQLFVFSLKFK
jgi:hypothetical protein